MTCSIGKFFVEAMDFFREFERTGTTRVMPREAWQSAVPTVIWSAGF